MGAWGSLYPTSNQNGEVPISGSLAGAVLGVFLSVYVLFRGRTLVAFFKSLDENMARMPDRVIFSLLIVGFVGIAFVLGALAGFVYNWVGSGSVFLGIGLGLAALFSFLAVVSRTPLKADKIFWNFTVGGVLGVMIPLFAGL